MKYSLRKYISRFASGKNRQRVAIFFISLVGSILFASIMTQIVLHDDSRQPAHTEPAGNTEVSQNPLSGQEFYVNPVSNGSRQAREWRQLRPDDARLMDKLAAMPAARWVVGDEDFTDLAEDFKAVRNSGKIGVAVLYNIPGRDCGQYSAGGAMDTDEYVDFIDNFVIAAAKTKLIVIVEPDALAQLETRGSDGQPCLTKDEQTNRTSMLHEAVKRLSAMPNSHVYLDAGNSAWNIAPADMAARLRSAGISKADGFSLNVSNFRSTDETTEYGDKLSGKLDGAHYVIDTSRNGLGPYKNQARPDYNWCNPPGRAMGHYPTTVTKLKNVDAFLYVKGIGESDGSDPDPQKCFRGPAAGKWSPEYALGLVKRWPAELQPPR